jgi:NDP-sugar pyrophosphorylase family protein
MSQAARHAVILAAGASTRTRPLTEHRPKPLIPLLGRPLLAHILDALHGLIERATLVVGYRADQIEAAFGASYRGIALRYTVQQQVNGTAGALLAAAPLAEPFFLLYGDNLIAREDVLGVSGRLNMLAGLPVADARAFGVLDCIGDRVQRIIEKPQDPPPHPLANPGVFHFGAEAAELAAQIRPSPRGELELTDLIELLAARGPVGYHICQGHWIPVGTPWEALAAARYLLRTTVTEDTITRGALIAPTAEIRGPVTIAAGAQIGPHARIIGPAYIGAGAEVARGAVLIESVLEPNTVLDSGAQLIGSVLSRGAHVGAHAVVRNSWLDDEARIGAGSLVNAAEHEALQPAAATCGRLMLREQRTLGAVIGRDVNLPVGTILNSGSIVTTSGA